jgi:hypothetical protein
MSLKDSLGVGSSRFSGLHLPIQAEPLTDHRKACKFGCLPQA